jgi:hypothetical protein
MQLHQQQYCNCMQLQYIAVATALHPSCDACRCDPDARHNCKDWATTSDTWGKYKGVMPALLYAGGYIFVGLSTGVLWR